MTDSFFTFYKESSRQEPKNEDNSSGNNGDNNGGDKEPEENPCLKNPELCADAGKNKLINKSVFNSK